MILFFVKITKGSKRCYGELVSGGRRLLQGLHHFTTAQYMEENPYEVPSQAGGTEDLDLVGAGTGQQEGFLNVVKGAINWLLGILALIALVILLYGGFLMVTSAGDEEKYKKGFTILRHAAIGLILIGVAWFIVSIIFFVVNLITGSANPGG